MNMTEGVKSPEIKEALDLLSKTCAEHLKTNGDVIPGVYFSRTGYPPIGMMLDTNKMGSVEYKRSVGNAVTYINLVGKTNLSVMAIGSYTVRQERMFDDEKADKNLILQRYGGAISKHPNSEEVVSLIWQTVDGFSGLRQYAVNRKSKYKAELGEVIADLSSESTEGLSSQSVFGDMYKQFPEVDPGTKARLDALVGNWLAGRKIEK